MVWPFTRIYITIWEKVLGPKGEKNEKGLSSSPFLVLNAKGGERINPKAKGPHHHHFKNFTNKYFNWYLIKINFQLVCEVNFSIGISFDISKLHIKYERISIGIISLHIYFKTLLKAKRRIHLGKFLFIQRKIIWNRGRNFKS